MNPEVSDRRKNNRTKQENVPSMALDSGCNGVYIGRRLRPERQRKG